MKRTISLKLILFEEQKQALLETRKGVSQTCNEIVSFVVEHRCWNHVALHNLCYTSVREKIPAVGSQMVCNAIRKVCASYKVLKIKKSNPVPEISFRERGSVHYCARTFSIKENTVSLFSVSGRIRCEFKIGPRQAEYLMTGKTKEAELIKKNNDWFLNVVIDLPDPVQLQKGGVFAVDLGENNLAVTSKGTIYGGGKLRHKRDKFLSRRKKLQSNGSKAAKRCLKKISGKEKRCVQQKNHAVSKAIIAEAVRSGTRALVMEKLKHIRKRIKAGKRVRFRLHRWAFDQLQEFIEYKAQAEGIEVMYVNPAYTSKTCSFCGFRGSRHKHSFSCSNCGSHQHSDRNAAVNLCRLATPAGVAMAQVNVPMVAAVIG